MPDAEQVVVDAVRKLLDRKGLDPEISLGSNIYDDLGLDSLDVAELSAMLEDTLGKDPYNEGLSPRTIGAILDWYKG